MAKKNIAFLISNIDNGGGTERVSLLLGDYLCEQGYNVTFFSYYAKGKPFFKYNEKIRIIGFEHYSLLMKLLCRFFPSCDDRLRFLLKLFRINVIIDVGLGQAMYSSAAIQGTKCKEITWDHFVYYVNKKLESRQKGLKCCKSSASKLVVLTKGDRELYIEKENLQSSFIEQVYNPITFDVERYIKHDQKVVVSVGRLEKEKGFDNMLRIWSFVEKTHPEWILNIYGSGSEEDALKGIIKKLNLRYVILNGHTNDTKEKLAKSSIFVLTSHYEGFGLALLEAETMSLPVISFNCPIGPSEIVEDGKNGYLIEPGDLEGFAEKLSKLMDDAELREKFGRESFEISKKFRKENIFPKWIDIIDSV